MKKIFFLFLIAMTVLFESCSSGTKKKIVKFDSIGLRELGGYQLRGKVKKLKNSYFETGFLKTQILCFDVKGRVVSDDVFNPGQNARKIFIRKNDELVCEKIFINDELTDSTVYFFGKNECDSLIIDYGLLFVNEKHNIYYKGCLIKKIYLTHQSIQRIQGKPFGDFWFNSLKDTILVEENTFDSNGKILLQVDTRGNNYVEKRYFDSLENVIVDTLIENGQYESGKIEILKSQTMGMERIDTISKSLSNYSTKVEIHKYKYDDQGNCIEDDFLKGKIEKNKFQLLSKPEICNISYTYDEHGNWTKAEYTYDSGKKPETITREIEYYK